ncbi:MAG TPA: cytochrome c [Aliiroseovarius sp.]|nr:cytochrome c [Aliiroseovarius sp.]
MITPKSLIAATLISGLAATAIFAASHGADFKNEIDARKAQMRLYAFNISQLGGMAKGMIPYDSDQAAAAAANIAALTKLNAGAMWPEGSDSLNVEGTRALPDLWDDMADVQAKGMALAKAADAMAAAAGTGLENLQAALGPLGGSCAACHKAFRQPE